MPEPIAIDRSEQEQSEQCPSEQCPSERSTRGRMGSVPGVRILGSGAFVPDNLVTNDDLAALGCDSEWIIRRTGILERRHATDDQATSDLCYEAAVRCLQDASVSAEELDLILVATITPDHFTPSTACHLPRRTHRVAAA
ncbi:MAG: ketoacyl-ACP synthase III, partial [Planctomycetota bacterium]